MRCPKCAQLMEKVPTEAGVVDRCKQCQGLWFDMLEHQDLKGLAHIVDTGSKELGARYNKLDQIRCPVCPNSKLLRMVDAEQPHIWFESCPTCYGRFYDAGEYRDYATLSLADLVRRFFVKARD